jgi:hypothetical protein
LIESSKENPLSIEEKPLPDFAGEAPAVKPSGLPVRPVAGRGVPRNPATVPESAFSIIESDETSRTLDFGMSEEDMLDDSDGEGSSSELHDSLRALHEKPGVVEEDFTALSSDYASGIREEDTYRKSESVTDFELPDLDGPTPVHAPDLSLSLPDFSKYDEVEEEKAVPTKSTPLEEIEEPKKKVPLKLLLVIAAVVLVVVVILVLVALPGSAAPAVITPAVDQITHLLR